MPATLPSGAESTVAFISGVTNTATVAGTSYSAWNLDAPATYGLTLSGTTNQSLAYKWGSTTLAVDGTSGGNVTYWFDVPSAWTNAEQNAFVSGLNLWAAMVDITFSLASSASAANIIFQRGTGGNAATSGSTTSSTIGSGTTGTPRQATITIDDTGTPFGPIGDPSLASSFDQNGGYVFNTIVHEIGHALGLGHGGPYDAGDNLGSVPARQFSVYDMRLWSIMSYIDPDDNTAAQFGSYPVTNTDWILDPPIGVATEYFSTTPMILDILAMQRLYGVATSGPLTGGNLVFGFNSNIQGDVGNYYNFNINQTPIVTIWAAGGNNTIDLSGFSEDSKLNLNFNSFSSAHGLVNNIAIAPDTQIKTGITGSGDDTIIGNGSPNRLVGNGGDDRLFGNAGADILEGGPDDDHLRGGSGDIFGSVGDLLNGGDGFDTAYYDDSIVGVAIDLLDGSAQGDTATGDIFISIENLFGSFFADALYGDGNANILWGWFGDDILEGRGGGDDFLGGDGNDTVYYDLSNAGVTVDLRLGIGVDGDAQGDSFVDIENLLGSPFDDTLIGDDKANVLAGEGANDILIGREGPDTLIGGANIDTADYSQSAQSIDARLDLGQGFGLGDSQGDLFFEIENVIGSSYGDSLYGDGNANRLQGGVGHDHLQGGDGADILDGGDDIDTARYDLSSGGVFVDLLLGRGFGLAAEGDILLNIEDLYGSNHDDDLWGDEGDNAFLGFDGDDELLGRGGNDALTGGLGEDVLLGELGDDRLAGGPDLDWLDGGDDTDTALFSGNKAEYTIAGTRTNLTVADTFDMRDGFDILHDIEFLQFFDGTFAVATFFNDPPTITSNEGGDTASLSLEEGTVVVTTVQATDVNGDELTYSIVGGDDALLFTIVDGALSFSNAPDYENPADVDPDNVYEVTVQASDGNGGIDTQALSVTVTNVVGVSPPPSNAATITGTDEEDELIGENGTNNLLGLGGNDMLTGGSGADMLDGGDGNDTLAGDRGNDTLDGGDGNDTLVGGQGADQLLGGDGSDTFVFEKSPGIDTIVDFLHGIDIIDSSVIDANHSVKGDQAFVFGGETSKVLANSVTWYENGTDTIIQADVNGDKNGDIMLVLVGINHNLMETDFLL
jgi:Ca2+-binding RTX toxin-like protein